MRYPFIILVLIFAAFLAGPPAMGARNDEQGFQKLEDVLRYAWANNPTLRAARAELKATHERLPQALAGWKPSLDASGNILVNDISGSNFGGADGGTSKEVSLEFTQPVFRGGRTIAATKSAMNAIAAQQALLKSLEQKIMLDVATAYMDVVRDESLLALSVSNETLLEKQREATQARFAVGELTKTDVSQAEARLARAAADRIKDSGNLQKSRAVYEQVVGMAAGVPGHPDLKFPMPDTLEEAKVFAEDHNPDVRAAAYLHKAAEKDVDEIFGELLPALDLSGSWDRQYDPQPGLIKESTSKSVGLSATFPLYKGGGTRSRVRQAKYTANQRYLEILEARRRVRQEIVTNWENLRTAHAEAVARQSQVKASAIAQEGVRAEAELGARTILDSLDADQEYLDAQVELVRTRRDEVVAAFSLAGTLGLLTPEILGFPDLSEDYDNHLRRVRGKILGMDVDIDEEER